MQTPDTDKTIFSVGTAYGTSVASVALRSNAKALHALGQSSFVVNALSPGNDTNLVDAYDIRDIETHDIGDGIGLCYLDDSTDFTKVAHAHGPVYAVVSTEQQAHALTATDLSGFNGVLALGQAGRAALKDKCDRVGWIGQAYECSEMPWAARGSFGLNEDRPLIVITCPHLAEAPEDVERLNACLQGLSDANKGQATLALLASARLAHMLSAKALATVKLITHVDDEFRCASLLNAADCVVFANGLPEESPLCGQAATFGVPVVAITDKDIDPCDASKNAKFATSFQDIAAAVSEVFSCVQPVQTRQDREKRRELVLEDYSFAAVGRRIVRVLSQFSSSPDNKISLNSNR